MWNLILLGVYSGTPTARSTIPVNKLLLLNELKLSVIRCCRDDIRAIIYLNFLFMRDKEELCAVRIGLLLEHEDNTRSWGKRGW